MALDFSTVSNVTDLFSISFFVVNPISDGAYDDFRIFHSPGS